MRYPILVLAVMLALAPLGAAGGDRGGRDSDSRRKGGEGRQSSESQASERARQQTGGRVLGVSPSNEGYRVKVLTPKGEVRSIQVPGR